jgi:hypothetical protein
MQPARVQYPFEAGSQPEWIDQSIALWSALVRRFDIGSPLVLMASACRRLDDPRYEAPVYLATEPALTAQGDYNEIMAAMSRISQSRLCKSLGPPPGMIINLGRPRTTNRIVSYSLAGYPGTVFCDFVPHPIALAESIVHEWGHNVFNAILDVEQQSFDPEARFHSPWRHEPRPAFGMAHALFAFSLLCLFFGEIGCWTNLIQDRAYANARLRIEQEHLRYSRPVLEWLTETIASVRLRDLMNDMFELAIRGGPLNDE